MEVWNHANGAPLNHCKTGLLSAKACLSIRTIHLTCCVIKQNKYHYVYLFKQVSVCRTNSVDVAYVIGRFRRGRFPWGHVEPCFDEKICKLWIIPIFVSFLPGILLHFGSAWPYNTYHNTEYLKTHLQRLFGVWMGTYSIKIWPDVIQVPGRLLIGMGRTLYSSNARLFPSSSQPYIILSMGGGGYLNTQPSNS